jgi:dual specificity protein kinase YAK1
MWSLGCVAAELFLGLPLFPGACEHDLLGRIVSTLGPLPDFLLTSGKNARKFFSVQEELVADPTTGEARLPGCQSSAAGCLWLLL